MIMDIIIRPLVHQWAKCATSSQHLALYLHYSVHVSVDYVRMKAKNTTSDKPNKLSKPHLLSYHICPSHWRVIWKRTENKHWLSFQMMQVKAVVWSFWRKCNQKLNGAIDSIQYLPPYVRAPRKKTDDLIQWHILMLVHCHRISD